MRNSDEALFNNVEIGGNAKIDGKTRKLYMQESEVGGNFVSQSF